MPNNTNAIAAKLQEHRAAALMQSMGLTYQPELTYRVRDLWDSQPMSTDDTEVPFFDTATSSYQLHDYGWAGCSLREVGQIDDLTDVILLGVGVQFIRIPNKTAADVADLVTLQECGVMTSLWFGRDVVLPEILFSQMQLPEGLVDSVISDGGAAAAYTVEHVSTGTPGFPGYYVLPPYMRAFGRGGETLRARCLFDNNGGDLAAAQKVRLRLKVLEIAAS